MKNTYFILFPKYTWKNCKRLRLENRKTMEIEEREDEFI